MNEIVIERATDEDAAEILVLQRCCWVSEAISNNSMDIPPLHEDLPTVRAWVQESTVWTARRGGRLVGAVRGTGGRSVVDRARAEPCAAVHCRSRCRRQTRVAPRTEPHGRSVASWWHRTWRATASADASCSTWNRTLRSTPPVSSCSPEAGACGTFACTPERATPNCRRTQATSPESSTCPSRTPSTPTERRY